MNIFGANPSGIDAELIRFKALKDPGRSGAAILGLAKTQVREGYHRAENAIATLDGDWAKVVKGAGYIIQLDPAEVPKTSAGLDLPLAILLLQAGILQNLDSLNVEIERLESKAEEIGFPDSEKRERQRREILDRLAELMAQKELIYEYRKRISEDDNNYLLIGELDIVSGEITPPKFGMFSMIASAEPGFKMIVPEASATHAALVAVGNPGVEAYVANDLKEVWECLLGVREMRKAEHREDQIKEFGSSRYVPDWSAVRGIGKAKRAMMVALAGGHNILLVGPPGQGKSMLAGAATNLLPTLGREEIFEINKIYSARGLLGRDEIVARRPFREVSSNITKQALLGGGRAVQPGEVSLANKGILLIDEINLLPGDFIEELRTVLNNREVRIQRVEYSARLPAEFILVAAMNPCKCGWYGHTRCEVCNRRWGPGISRCTCDGGRQLLNACTCGSKDVSRFRDKLSQPLLERIDLKVLVSEHVEESSEADRRRSSTIRKEIERARQIQVDRYGPSLPWRCNAYIPDRDQFNQFAGGVSPEIHGYLSQLKLALNLSRRLEVKLLLVSRTIADLDGADAIDRGHMDEAVALMGLQDLYFRGFNRV